MGEGPFFIPLIISRSVEGIPVIYHFFENQIEDGLKGLEERTKYPYKNSSYMIHMVHLVLHPHGIAPTFLKLNSWSSGADFIPIMSTKGIN